MIYETNRPIVRHIGAADDLDVLFEVYSNPRAMIYVHDGKPLPNQGCVDWVERILNNCWSLMMGPLYRYNRGHHYRAT